MTFIEAAIAVLEDAGGPLSVEELTERAVERDLLAKPGKNPLRSMKGRLTTELNKGDDSRLAKVEDGVWALASGAAGKKGKGKKATAKKAPARAKKPASKKAADARAKGTKDKPAKTSGKKKSAKAADKDAAADKKTAKKATKKSDDEASKKGKTQKKTSKKAEKPEEERELTDEEKALSEIYAEEAKATVGVGEINEYRDEQTADEDREMLPEIVADKRGRDRGKDRGRRRRRRRDRSKDSGDRKSASSGDSSKDSGDRKSSSSRDSSKDSGDRNKRKDERARSSRSSRGNKDEARDSNREVSVDLPPAPAPVGLVENAAEVLREVSARAIPVRQLTQMMRKRRMLDENPESSVPLVRGALRYGEAWSERRGTRPLVKHTGRDRYAVVGPVAGDDVLFAAEVQVDQAVAALEAASTARFGEIVANFDVSALERLVQLYLESRGYSDVHWVKRAGRSGYATAEGPNGSVLVGARVGPEPVDRRGVGELRVGVEAKGTTSGLLLAPTEMSDEAIEEWNRGGPPVAVECGNAFIVGLMQAGIGVRWRMAPVPLLDDEFFDAVQQG